MKPLLIKLMLPALLAVIIVACGGGGGGFAGIGGSGYVSSGTVTGFGSVISNGYKFSTNPTTTKYEAEDDDSATQADLRIGMQVQIKGTINADGVTGIADFIHFGDDLEGPISAPVQVSIDGATKTLDIMGITVLVNSVDTKFYDNNGIADATIFDGLAARNVLEISGYYDASDVLHASYVKLKAFDYTDNVTEFEVTGRIRNLLGSTFKIRGMSVNTANASLSNFDNGLESGLYVEVKGTFDGKLQAREVEQEEIDLVEDGREVSIEGYITDFNGTDIFRINGYLVNVSGASLEPTGLNLRDGIVVEAEGTVSNGIFYATEIESEDDARASAYVSSVDTLNNQISLQVVAGEPPVTVQVTADTVMEDDTVSTGLSSISDLNPNDFVEVKGYQTGTEEITARLVKRVDAGNIELQGVVTSQTEDVSVTVLGVVFPVTTLTYTGPNPTKYAGEIEQPYTHAEFMNNAVPGQSVISIEDKDISDGNALGIADSVEIEIR